MSESSPPPPPLPVLNAWFSPGQRRLISLAVLCAAAAVVAVVFYEVLNYLRLFVATFSTVIWPLAIASIFSLLMRPLVDLFQKKFKLSRGRSIIWLYGLVVTVCLFLAGLVLPLIVDQAYQISASLPHTDAEWLTLIHSFSKKITGFFQAIGVTLSEQQVNDFGGVAIDWIKLHLTSASGDLQSVKEKAVLMVELAASIAVIPIYIYFLLESNHNFMADIRLQLTFLKPSLRYDIVFLVEEFVSILVSFFRGQFLVGLCLGVIKAIGFTIIGVKFGLVMGLVFGMLNVIPYLGSMLGVCVVLPIAFFQDGGGIVLVLLAVGVFVGAHMIESYFLVPKIMGHRTGLHPMVIIISIFFWGKAFDGVLGMILAVPLTAFLVVAWRLVRAKYLPKHGTGLTRFPMPVASTRNPIGGPKK